MKSIILFAVVGFVLALLPARFWTVVGLFAAAAIFALGIWAAWMIITGMVNASREENGH